MGVNFDVFGGLLGLGNFYIKGRRMTQQDIIRMAREAGIEVNWSFDFQMRLERFASLVAEHAKAEERKEILVFASSEAFNRQYGERSPFAYELEKEIRARGQA